MMKTIKNGVNRNASVRAIILITALALVMTPVHATLGGQRFPNVDWNDDNITNEEIAIAQSSFSNAGVLPGSPFYFMKRWGEDLQLAFTFNDTDRAKLRLERAQTRLAELKKLIEGNKTEHVREISDDFTEEMGKCRNYTWLYNDSIKKNAIVLGIVNQNAPDNARDFIERAFNNSIDDDVRARMRAGMRGREFGLPPLPPRFADTNIGSGSGSNSGSGKYDDNSNGSEDDDNSNSGSNSDDD